MLASRRDAPPGQIQVTDDAREVFRAQARRRSLAVMVQDRLEIKKSIILLIEQMISFLINTEVVSLTKKHTLFLSGTATLLLIEGVIVPRRRRGASLCSRRKCAPRACSIQRSCSRARRWSSPSKRWTVWSRCKCVPRSRGNCSSGSSRTYSSWSRRTPCQRTYHINKHTCIFTSTKNSMWILRTLGSSGMIQSALKLITDK